MIKSQTFSCPAQPNSVNYIPPNEQMTCVGPVGFFRTSSDQPVQPYLRQIINVFSIGLRQQRRTVV